MKLGDIPEKQGRLRLVQPQGGLRGAVPDALNSVFSFGLVICAYSLAIMSRTSAGRVSIRPTFGVAEMTAWASLSPLSVGGVSEVRRTVLLPGDRPMMSR